MLDANLRGMFDAFCEVYEPAAEVMRTGELQGAIKGAPLRCSLRGSRWSRPGRQSLLGEPSRDQRVRQRSSKPD